MTAVEDLAPVAWRETVARALANGERFAGAWVSGRGTGSAWRALLTSPHGHRVISCPATDGQVESIVDLAEAAAWDEREAHDLYGLGFPGHAPLRALAAHPEDDAAWLTPVAGEGVHQVAVGPIHAGVIESGHFRFHVVGERILAVDLRLFFKHRGLERAAEGHSTYGALRYAERACAACAVANTLAYAHAVEDALGLQPDRALRVNRTILLELERLYNHLHDIAAICAGVGFAPGSMAFAALKDRAQQINQRAFAHRFLFGTISVGGARAIRDGADVDAARGALRELRSDTAAAWRELAFAGSLQARLDGVGVLSLADAQRLGSVGPAARACGIREDARAFSPRLAYEGFRVATAPTPSGDVAARLRVRAVELEATYEILEDLLDEPPTPGVVHIEGVSTALGVGTVESPRGATTCAVELDGSRVARLRLRTGSYANWPAVASASAGSLLSDFPLINKSFELCYACVDR